MSILVTGSTGTVGTYLIKSLVKELKKQNSTTKIRLLVRDVEKAKKLFSEEESNLVEYYKGDITDLETAHKTGVFDDVERLFLLVVSSPFQKQQSFKLVKHNVENGSPKLKQVVRLSVLGSDLNDDQNSLFRWHADSDRIIGEYLEERNVSLTIVSPNLFLQNFLRDDAFGIKAQNAFYRPGLPDNLSYKISHVDVRDIADASAVILTEPVEKHAGRTYKISGPESLSYEQVATALSNVLERTVQSVAVDDQSYFSTLVGFGVPEAFALTYVKLYQYYKQSNTTATVYGDYSIITGKPARTVQQFFQDHKNSFVQE